MKNIIIIILIGLILCSFNRNAYCQNKEISGKYEVSELHSMESIILLSNGQFIYRFVQEFIDMRIMGNWQVRDRKLVLDSRPQHDRIIVQEDYNRKSKNRHLLVYDKKHLSIKYQLHAITNSNDTLISNEFETSILQPQVVKFYLVATNGISSPTYTISNQKSNIFTCFFEITRVFENEEWEIKGDDIIPKNSLGRIQKYALKKVQ